MNASLREIARILGGEVSGHQVITPGPNHGRQDRSLCVKLDPRAPGGFLVHSFSNDDWRDCRDYVAGKLGIVREFQATPRNRAPPRQSSGDQTGARIARAVALWNEAGDPRGTIVETYLESRGLALGEAQCAALAAKC